MAPAKLLEVVQRNAPEKLVNDAFLEKMMVRIGFFGALEITWSWLEAGPRYKGDNLHFSVFECSSMSALEEHLQVLVSGRSSNQEDEKEALEAIEEWRSNVPLSLLHSSLEPTDISNFDNDRNSASLFSLIDWGSPDDSLITSHSDDLDALALNPKVAVAKETIISLLQSKRNNEEISAELAELLGYDEIEVVMQIVSNRSQMQAKLKNVGNSEKKSVPPVDDYTPDAARRRMEAAFEAAANRPLFTGVAAPDVEVLPHVYTSASMTLNNPLSTIGSKYMLPLGTTRNYTNDYEEVIVPPAKTVPPKATERLIPCSELPPLAKSSFPGYQSLNRIQSIVYPTAFRTNENMLVCAPTGAGKTDVAMLTILRVIDQHRDSSKTDIPKGVRHNDFKIIYVAPMKALAAEIVRKLGKRLAWLRIIVKELTGDMQLTKAEIAETQIIVTTPEKWDVVTRKPTGEGELATQVKLLIIDEVHLLDDERGAVIETIVARTIRQVESTQSLIRVVGLSATLPNFIDVADFLRVSRHQGLFFFDSSFRPVPLEQHFLGIKGKPGSVASKKNFDRVAYEKVIDLVREGHQVMVFVHTRKETVKSAQSLQETAIHEGELDFFSCAEHPQFELYRRDIARSKNREMKELFNNGFGIHHAGMLRSDRNLMERLFEAKVIKVLCCTATLAWGVNLPAHAVVIKGTQLYDPAQGKFIDLSVLDVLQIFGRAGRPGMETSGVGFICTTEDKLTHYLDAVTAQHPIESKFTAGLLDSLNAEIALGTVANVPEAAEWLSYTYYFVRMRKNPMVYGLTHDDPVKDPDLVEHRHAMIIRAAKELHKVGMVKFDEIHGAFATTDIGRIAAKYYIRHASIEVFQKEFKARMTEADVLALLSMSTEFDQIQVRENEVEELKALEEDMPCQVKGGTDTSQGKVNILVQAYISRRYVEDFALVSDSMYAAQNAGRIVRALLEIALSRKWAGASAVLMSISKSIEKRMWGYEHPLAQFDLSQDVMYNLTLRADNLEVWELASKSAEELGEILHLNKIHGAALLKAAKQFPTITISHSLRPLNNNLLKIIVYAERAFDWSPKVHGTAEPFWIWVEDHTGTNILQLSRVVFGQSSQYVTPEFIIPIQDGQLPESVRIRVISDKWIGSEEDYTIPFTDIVMPSAPSWHTPVLNLPFLSTSVLKSRLFEDSFRRRLRQFNSIQTQCFWSLYNTERNILVSAGTGSGKSVLGHLAMRRLLNQPGDSWGLVVVPNWSTARSLAYSLADILKSKVDVIRNLDRNLRSSQCRLRVITPNILYQALTTRFVRESNWLERLTLVVCENLELIDETYEISISLLLHATQTKPVRWVGLCTSINDPSDLAQWLRVPHEGCYSFKPTERDQALSVTSQTFTISHSAALFKAMAKPLHDTLRSVSQADPIIVFVPSRAQCYHAMTDLLRLCAVEMSMRGFLGGEISPEDLELHLTRIEDQRLVDGLTRGMALWHDGMDKAVEQVILQLFVEGIVRVLFVPRDSCWTVPVRAGLVVVMGTQYFQVSRDASGESKPEATQRQLVEYTLHELVQMQGRAVRHAQTGRFHIMCQAELRDAYMRFLNDGLPMESYLLETSARNTNYSQAGLLSRWFAQERKDERIVGKQDAVDILGFTYLSRRLATNPVYYDVDIHAGRDVALSRLVDRMFEETNPKPMLEQEKSATGSDVKAGSSRTLP